MESMSYRPTVADRMTARIFVLGAGFSAPAGLPLSRDLLQLVLEELDGIGHSGHLRSSLEDYVAYKVATEGMAPDPIDLEDFAASLDYEHFLGQPGVVGEAATLWVHPREQRQLSQLVGIADFARRHRWSCLFRRCG
jgi:hypothetical protein